MPVGIKVGAYAVGGSDDPRPRRLPPGPGSPPSRRYAVPGEGGGLLRGRGARVDDGVDLASLPGGLVAVPGVTTIVDDMQLREGYEGVDPEVLANASRRGTKLHDWIDAELRGEGTHLPDLDEKGHGYLDSWRRWRDEWRVREDCMGEERVYFGAYSNAAWTKPDAWVVLSAGTLDRVLRDDAGVFMVDWKFRSAAPKVGDGPQLAGYLLALSQDPDPAIRELARKASKRRYVVGLDPYGGAARVRRYADDGLDERAFLGAAIRWHRLAADAEGVPSPWSDEDVARAARAVRTWRFVRGTK